MYAGISIQQGCSPRNMNCVITLKLINNISESYDAMASKVDVLHHKMYNRRLQVFGKTFENLEIPGKPKELLVYGSKV